jgi:hypothetical protein
MASPNSIQSLAMPASNETQPLLNGYSAHHRETSPPAYGALDVVDDDDWVTYSDEENEESTLAASTSEIEEQNSSTLLNSVSRLDFYLILAALWSAVFLGALDGGRSPRF